MGDVFDSPAYKKSRAAYHIQCITEYLVTLLMADAFLAKLLKHLGLSDSVIGIVGSLMSLAFLIQFATIFLMRHIRDVKKTVIFFDILSMLSFLCVYLLPFFHAAKAIRTMLVFLTIGGGFLFKYLQLNLYYKWGNSFVRPQSRGSFSAKNEAISLAAGIVFTLAAGRTVDVFEEKGEIEKSFLVIACIIAFLAILDFFMLLSIKKYSAKETKRQQKSIRDVLLHTIGNRNFRNVVIMISMYDMARYLTIGFLGTFKTQELLLSVGVVQMINVCANILRCILSRPVGRWADRTSFAHVYRKGLWVCALSFLLLAFTTRATWWLMIAYTILYNVSMTGIPGNANNMTYSYVAMDYFVQAQAIRCGIAGTLGFLASVTGSCILEKIQENGNEILGCSIYGQQFLAGLSFLILVAAIIFNKCVVEKQEVMVQ